MLYLRGEEMIIETAIAMICFLAAFSAARHIKSRRKRVFEYDE
jgi:uncharacterized membrane protein (UPF0136 family)